MFRVFGFRVSAWDLRREFKLDSGSTSKYKSPLTTSESQYAQVGYNAVYAAAHALGASDEELKEALTEAKNDNSRKYCLKANYVVLCRHRRRFSHDMCLRRRKPGRGGADFNAPLVPVH